MAERKMADALDELYNDGVKTEVQKAKNELITEFNTKLENKADKGSSDFAPLNSPALTGTPTAPTPAVTDDSGRIATTAYCLQLIQNLIGSAPAVLDTLGEIASALKNNPNVIQEILNSLANKADKTAATSSTLGLTKLYTSTGTNTDGTMTQAAIKSALDGKASSGILDNMCQNSLGQSTYLWVSQKVVTDGLNSKVSWDATSDELGFYFTNSSTTSRRGIYLKNSNLNQIVFQNIMSLKFGYYCDITAVAPDNIPSYSTQIHLNAPGGVYVNGTKIG